MDKKLFLKSLNGLESAFGEKLNEDRAKIYWDILKNYSDIEMKKAVVKSIRELKYFPKISEIISVIEGNSEDEAELAWQYFKEKLEDKGGYMSVSFPKYPAVAGVIDALGGWIKIGETLLEEEKWVKKDFIKLYSIMKKRGDHPKELPGIFEIGNSNKGYTEKTMLERYGRRLDGKKVDRKLIKGGYEE